MHLMQ